MEFETQQEHLAQIEKEWKQQGYIGEKDKLIQKGSSQFIRFKNKDDITVETQVFPFSDDKITTLMGMVCVNDYPQNYTGAEQPITTFRRTKIGLTYNYHYNISGLDMEYMPMIYEKSGDISDVSKQCFLRYMGDMMGNKIIPRPLTLGKLIHEANKVGYDFKPKDIISKQEILDTLWYLSEHHIRGVYWKAMHTLMDRCLISMMYPIKYKKKREEMYNDPIKSPNTHPFDRRKLIRYCLVNRSKYATKKKHMNISKELLKIQNMNSDKIQYYDSIIETMRDYWGNNRKV